MSEPKEALALCVRRDPKHGDKAYFRPGLIKHERNCAFCGVDVWASPTTTAMESDPNVRVVYACNPCGNREVASRGVKRLGIAPGALSTNDPNDRRRRNELEAHGFTDLDPKDIE